MPPAMPHAHSDAHAFTYLNPRVRDGLTVHSRRSVLKASLAGLAGLSLSGLLKARADSLAAPKPMPSRKSVILLWMTGGPSHIDTWDVKPEMPAEIRGPFKDIPTKLPGVHICEHYPKQAAMMDKFTLIRSVDCRESNHEPNMVMQTANLAAEPRINTNGHLFSAIGSVVSKFCGSTAAGLPPYVVLNLKDRSHVARGGYLGNQYDPFVAKNLAQAFQLAGSLTMDRLRNRRSLVQQMDGVRADLDASGQMEAMDRFAQQAFDIVAGGRAQNAFDLSKEPAKIVER